MAKKHKELLDEVFGTGKRVLEPTASDSPDAAEMRRRKELLDKIIGTGGRAPESTASDSPDAAGMRRRKELLGKVSGAGGKATATNGPENTFAPAVTPAQPADGGIIHTPKFRGKKKLAFLEQSQRMQDEWLNEQGSVTGWDVPERIEDATAPTAAVHVRTFLASQPTYSGVLADSQPETEETIRSDEVVLPSGTVLRKGDFDFDEFFRQQVVPTIDRAEQEAGNRYEKVLTERYAPQDRSWTESFKAALRTVPNTGAASTVDLIRNAGEARRERGPARIVKDVMEQIDPKQVTDFIADHLKDDREYAAALEEATAEFPAEGSLPVSEEEVERFVSEMSESQRKQYEKQIRAEENRISEAQEKLQKAAAGAWERQSAKFQQALADRLIDEMARRNMPRSELEAFARTVYDASIPGLLTEWAVGNVAGGDKALHAQIMQRALEKYDPSLLTRIGGEAAALLLGAPVFGAGGALGKAGAAGVRKLAERNVLRKLLSRGITGGAEGIAQRTVARSLPARLAQGAVASGTTLGAYDVVSEPLQILAAGGNPEVKDIVGAGARGFATGMLLPGIGMAAGRAADAATSRLGRYAAELGGFAAENAAFVGMGTLYQGLRTGEWGTPEQLAEELGHSVGVLGIMKGIGALKRNRVKHRGFYDKVLAETEFTSEEVEALNRIGVDGRSYKRAIFDLLDARETAAGREVAKRSAEQVDSRYAEVMQSPEVPFSAKAKLMYLVEGRIPSTLPLTTDVRRTENEDGRTTVDLLDPAGNLVQRRTFSSEKAAEAFERESAGLREINTIQYYEALIGRMQALDEAARDYAVERGVPVEAVKKQLRDAAEGRPHDREVVRRVAQRARPEEVGMDIPTMIAEEVGRKYGLGDEGMVGALTLKESVRTPEQRSAVKEYAARLKQFATQELRPEAATPEMRAERQLMQVADQAIAETKNRDDDVVYTATMKDGSTVNIIKGSNLVYDAQSGEVNAAQSDPTVVVRYEDGTLRQVSVGDIDMIDEAVSAADAQAEAWRAIREQLEAAARNEAVADAVDSAGMVQLADGRIGVVEGRNEDGTYSVAVQDGEGRIASGQVAPDDIVGPVENGAEAEPAQAGAEEVIGAADSMPGNPQTEEMSTVEATDREIPRLKDGQPDYNAMPADMLAAELSAVIGHDRAVERLQFARSANAKKADKLENKLAGMADLNRAMAAERSLDLMRKEDARLAGALEQLGAIEAVPAEMEQLTEAAVRGGDDTLPRDRQDTAAEEEQSALREIENNGIFAEKETQPEVYGKTESGRDKNEPTSASGNDGGGLVGNATGAVSEFGDRGDIRVFEEGLGAPYDEHSEYSERDRREAESERLVAVSKENGLHIDPEQWNDFGVKYPKRTGESVVFIDAPKGRVYKIKDPYAKAAIKGVQPEDAIYEHIVHNLLFPESKYRFEGISEHLGDVRIVLSQDYIDSFGQPTQQQIDAALAARGLFPEDRYSYGNDLVSVTDVEGDNVLLGNDGRLYFIDPVIRLKRPAREVIAALEESKPSQRAESDERKADDSIDSDVPFSVRSVSAAAPAGVTPERWNVIVEQLRGAVGAENVVTDAEQVRSAYERIMRRSEEIRRQQVVEANERFNELLGQMTLENADSTILDLGMPSSEMLAAGIADKPLRLYGNKLLKKAGKHGYALSDVRDLPEALERPIAIFQGSKVGSFAVLTEIKVNNQNILVTLRIGRGIDIDFNVVSFVYGKTGGKILNWINNNKLLFADKEKTLNYLHYPAPIAETLRNPESINTSDKLVTGGFSGPSASDQRLVTAVKIVTNFENPKIGPENMQRSIAADRTLVGVHNLTQDNILHAFRMGGLANPSLAVIDAAGGEYENFGDITLLAPRGLIDKSTGKNIGTFGADIYSPRYPQVERLYGDKLKKFAKELHSFVEQRFDANHTVAKRYVRSSSYLQPQYASEGERALKREPFMQAYYAEHILGETVPRNATVEQIDAFIPDATDYFQWVNDTFAALAEKEVIPNGVTPTGRRRYLDHTLENVSRYMKAQGRNGSEGYNYGLGTLRSHFAPKFTTLKQIRSAKKRLQTVEEFIKTKRAFEEEYDALVRELSETATESGTIESSHLRLVSALLSKQPEAELLRDGYSPSEELIHRIVAFREALAQMPTEYFETKFERPVTLNEFAGAVVPDDLSPKAMEALHGSGIRRIETYDPTRKGARKDAFAKLADALDEDAGIYFMQTPEGEVYGFTSGGVIYLDSSRMNAATPMHEYTELWSQIVAREQPELWKQGVELLKQTETWKEVNADSYYKHLSEQLRASETLSRIAATIFEEKQSAISEDAGLIDRLRKWLREFWKGLKATFSKWTKRELDSLTAEDVARMPVRDFLEGIDLGRYAAESGSEIRFTRNFTERRVTTPERLENKRAALVADRENIANFDEALAAVDAAIDAYKQSDPVAETFSEPEGDAHLRAVEDAVYDMQRKMNIPTQTDIVRDGKGFIDLLREMGASDADLEGISARHCPEGAQWKDRIILRADGMRSKDFVRVTYLHERAHGITKALFVPRQLYIAAKEMGADYMNKELERIDQSYHVDADNVVSMVEGANEMISRMIGRLQKNGRLEAYFATETGTIDPAGEFLDEIGTPRKLKELIIKNLQQIKEDLYGTEKTSGIHRSEIGNFDGGGIARPGEGSVAAHEGAGGPGVGTSIAGNGVEKGYFSGAAGNSRADIGQGADEDDIPLHRSGNAAPEERLGSDDRAGLDRNQELDEPTHVPHLRADGGSMRPDERRDREGTQEAGSDRGGIERGTGQVGDPGRVRNDDGIGVLSVVDSPNFSFQESESDRKLTKQQQLIADLRRSVRESKASARAVAQLVSRYVRSHVGRELTEVMGKREFDALIRQIESATVKQQVEKPLQRIEEIVTGLRIKQAQSRVDKLLQLKVQGEGTRGVSVAKEIDDSKRRMFTIFRDNIGRNVKEVKEELQGRADADPLNDLLALRMLDTYNEALQYRRDLKDIEEEQGQIRSRNTDLRRQRIAANKRGDTTSFERLKEEIVRNNELLDALDAERRQGKEHLAARLEHVGGMLAEQIGYGREILDEWRQKQKEHDKMILDMAFRDVGDGKKIPVLDRQPGAWEKGRRALLEKLLAPAYSLNYLLRNISVNAPKGEGGLYEHFMRSLHGYVESRGRFYLGYEDFKRKLGGKAQELFGESYPEVLKQSHDPIDATISVINGKEWETYHLTIGEALYIYMVNKMEDGKVKLRRMGITEADVEMLADTLPQQFIRFADWAQGEFLPERRKVYNATHLDAFGTQMAEIGNYIPLKIQKSNIYQKVDGTEPEPDTLPSAITGSIIQRKRNTKTVDLHTNALELLLEHGKQMEHWNAFTRIVQDMNMLLSSTAFRRMLDTRNPGLHKKLKIAAQLAADSYRPKTNEVNRAWVALGKLAASSKIAFRVNTALKQVLSFPAFYACIWDPKFWAKLTKNLSPTTWAKNFRWVLDNIPSFRERWLGRMAGNEKLSQATVPMLDKMLDKMNRYGMIPNAFVDALTCANGAKAVYDYKKEIYLKRGMGQEEAERRARIDAAVAINETQQSSEGMFISQMQADRDFWSVSLSTFQNSNFSYLRKVLEGIDELRRDADRERRNRAAYYKEEGLSEEEAFDRAMKDVLQAKKGAVLNILVFMFIMNMLWTLGNNVWKYLFSEDSRDEIPDELAKSALVSTVRNTSIGSVAESVANGYEANPSVLLSDLIGFYRRLTRIVEDENPDAWDQTIAYLTLQTLTANGLGVDLESFVNMYQGIAGMIRDGADVEEVMQVLNAPKSQAKLIAGKPKESETLEEYQQRMIFLERRIAARVEKETIDKWTRNYEAYEKARLLGMKTERNKKGAVSIPELKQLDADYAAALVQAGLTTNGRRRKEFGWGPLTPEEQELWRTRALYVRKLNRLEKELEKTVVFNEAYGNRLKELIGLKRRFVEELNQK